MARGVLSISPALRGWWALAALSGAALVYTHNYGIFAVATAPVIWLLCGPRRRAAMIRLSLVLGLILAAYLPWIPVLLRQARTDVGAWIAAMFRSDALLRSLGVFGTCVELIPSGGILPSRPPGWIPSAVWIGVVLIGSLILTARHARTRALAFSLGAFLLVPLLIPYLISLLGKPVYWVGRYEVVSYPGFALLVGLASERLLGKGGRRRRIAAALLALVMAAYAGLSLFVLVRYRARPAERAEERIAASLAKWISPGDLVIVTGLARAPIEYYLDRMIPAERPRLVSYPRATGGHLGWYDFASARRPGAMEAEARELVGTLSGFPGKVFLVDHSNFPEFRSLQEPLRRELMVRSTRRQVLLRAGPDPKAAPLYEVSVFTFALASSR